MNSNPYQAPKAELLEKDDQSNHQFYVVSRKKFLLLYIATLGFYSYYWFFINWHMHKRATGRHIWPLPRVVFQIFFIHSLFAKIDKQLIDQKQTYEWSPMAWATLLVLTHLTIVGYGIAEVTYQDNYGVIFIELIIYIVEPLVFLVAQTAINTANNDPKGASNNSLTTANYIWMFIGLFVWIIYGAAFAEDAGLISLDQLFTLIDIGGLIPG